MATLNQNGPDFFCAQYLTIFIKNLLNQNSICILSSKNPWYCHEKSLVVANRIPWSLPNKIPGSATLLHPHKGISQAVARAVKGNQVPMVGQAVNHGGRHLVIGKNGAPLGKLQVGSNDQAAPFVAA